MRQSLLNLSRRFLMLYAFGLASCVNLVTDAAPPIPVRTESGPEAEARAAFVNVMSVAKRKDVAAFRQLMAPDALADYDAREKDNPGMLVRMMTTLSEEKPKDFRLDLNGTLATLTRKTLPDPPDLTMPEATTVILEREGAQWKLGKPSQIAVGRDPAPDERASEASSPRKNQHHSKSKSSRR